MTSKETPTPLPEDLGATSETDRSFGFFLSERYGRKGPDPLWDLINLSFSREAARRSAAGKTRYEIEFAERTEIEAQKKIEQAAD